MGSRTDLHVQIGTITGQIYMDAFLKQDVCLLMVSMGAKTVFKDNNACSHRTKIANGAYINNCIYNPYFMSSILI